MSQTRENETGRGKAAFWYEPAVSGRTIVDDALSTPHPRAGRRQPVRTPAGHLSTAENGQEPPEGKTPATRENAETAYGKRYVDAVEEQPSPGSGNAHAQRLLELVNPLMTVFMEGCRDQATHQYWVRREPCRRDIGHPLRIALAIQPDACAHPKIGPRLSVVRIQDYETGTAVEVEALGETPAVVRAKATAEAPWRQIDFHDSDLNGRNRARGGPGTRTPLAAGTHRHPRTDRTLPVRRQDGRPKRPGPPDRTRREGDNDHRNSEEGSGTGRGNRDRRPGRVRRDRLDAGRNRQHAIEANDWAGPPLLTLVVRPDSRPVLIDGKHILSAHVEASRRNSGLRSLDYVVQVIRNLSPTEASSLYSTKTPFFEGSPAAG